MQEMITRLARIASYAVFDKVLINKFGYITNTITSSQCLFPLSHTRKDSCVFIESERGYDELLLQTLINSGMSPAARLYEYAIETCYLSSLSN